MGQLGFFVDMTSCIACKTCQIACKDKNNLEVGAIFRRVYTFEGGKFPTRGSTTSPWRAQLVSQIAHGIPAMSTAELPMIVMSWTVQA